LFAIFCRCQDLTQAILDAEKIPEIEGLVIQSNSSTTFSAGIDLAEMNQPDPQRLVRFWHSFQDLYMTLYGSRLACVAAMEGHALAGGCMIALSCDYRIMAATGENERPRTIGLNETKLGIAAPSWLVRQMIDTIGLRKAEMALQTGQIYSPEQALEINLVDEIVPKEEVRDRAIDIVQLFVQIPSKARYASKMLVRQNRIDALRNERQKDTDFFVSFVTEPRIQTILSDYLQALAKRRKK
jgi:Delta3-Delta2-enoyl-CoA isomerase